METDQRNEGRSSETWQRRQTNSKASFCCFWVANSVPEMAPRTPGGDGPEAAANVQTNELTEVPRHNPLSTPSWWAGAKPTPKLDKSIWDVSVTRRSGFETQVETSWSPRDAAALEGTGTLQCTRTTGNTILATGIISMELKNIGPAITEWFLLKL